MKRRHTLSRPRHPSFALHGRTMNRQRAPLLEPHAADATRAEKKQPALGGLNSYFEARGREVVSTVSVTEIPYEPLKTHSGHDTQQVCGDVTSATAA